MTLTMLLLTTPLLLAALLAGARREVRPPARHGRARHAARPRAVRAAPRSDEVPAAR
ncbi:hypothetical protein [Kitasatospora sp. NPDC057223]|uniref:hypothetical protein n=1 Tax=Kitasatospora sp. NPDC057223 TaxID=3346055 RepID=UPI003629F13E